MNQKIYGLSTELRAAGEGEAMMLEGRAIVFNTPTVLCEIDGIRYREIIDQRALDSADIGDVVMRYNHKGEAVVLARTRNKSLELEKRLDGLYVRAKLQPDIQQHKDIYNAVRSGLIDKMSFGFAIGEGGDKYDSSTHTRTVVSIRKLYDISVVDQPAYDQTYVEARSRLEQYADIEGYRQSIIIRSNLLRRRLYQ